MDAITTLDALNEFDRVELGGYDWTLWTTGGRRSLNSSGDRLLGGCRINETRGNVNDPPTFDVNFTHPQLAALTASRRTLSSLVAGGTLGARPGCRAYMPASRSLRNRADQRAMKRESQPSVHMMLSRDSPSSSIKINFARRLKTLTGLTPYEYICKISTTEPQRFILDPLHQMPGLNRAPVPAGGRGDEFFVDQLFYTSSSAAMSSSN